MPRPLELLRGAALLALLAAVAPAQAQRLSYCCTDGSGRQVCSDVLPQACWGREYREVDSRGVTLRRIEAPLSEEQQNARDAEARRKKAAERQAADERRRNRALLDAYRNEQDIDMVRDRTLVDIEKSLAQANERYGEAAKRQKELSSEMEFYRRKPAPKALLDDLRDNESELRAHASVIESKQKEIEAVRAKFEDEKRRYVELTKRSAEQHPAAVKPR